ESAGGSQIPGGRRIIRQSSRGGTRRLLGEFSSGPLLQPAWQGGRRDSGLQKDTRVKAQIVRGRAEPRHPAGGAKTGQGGCAVSSGRRGAKATGLSSALLPGECATRSGRFCQSGRELYGGRGAGSEIRGCGTGHGARASPPEPVA